MERKGFRYAKRRKTCGMCKHSTELVAAEYVEDYRGGEGERDYFICSLKPIKEVDEHDSCSSYEEDVE